MPRCGRRNVDTMQWWRRLGVVGLAVPALAVLVWACSSRHKDGVACEQSVPTECRCEIGNPEDQSRLSRQCAMTGPFTLCCADPNWPNVPVGGSGSCNCKSVGCALAGPGLCTCDSFRGSTANPGDRCYPGGTLDPTPDAGGLCCRDS